VIRRLDLSYCGSASRRPGVSCFDSASRRPPLHFGVRRQLFSLGVSASAVLIRRPASTVFIRRLGVGRFNSASGVNCFHPASGYRSEPRGECMVPSRFREPARTLCPSGLRGWTQVPLAQAAWVQIPQVSFNAAGGELHPSLAPTRDTDVSLKADRETPIAMHGLIAFAMMDKVLMQNVWNVRDRQRKNETGGAFKWPCGLMDKALVFGTKDCRFESCQGQLLKNSRRREQILVALKQQPKATRHQPGRRHHRRSSQTRHGMNPCEHRSHTCALAQRLNAAEEDPLTPRYRISKKKRKSDRRHTCRPPSKISEVSLCKKDC
jgi:hypothetical protein